ncbi:MAG: hypothetical protein GX224_03785 [Thermoplasmatales archaeon]|nr:hypothetical protein [Thermoplasmatales archaeon]
MRLRRSKEPNPGRKAQEIDLVRGVDKFVILLFAVSLIVSLAVAGVMTALRDFKFYDVMPLVAAPFFVIGVFWYVTSKRWYFFLAIAALLVALYFGAGVRNFVVLFFIGFVLVGTPGVVAVVEVLQRLIFYKVLGAVEYMNVKERLNMTERVVGFLFNVPHDLDSRNVTMDYNLKRASIPWKEVLETMYMGFMIGTFLWIYMTMNPSFMDAGILESPVYVFSIVLYIPVLVMPWSIFRSLNVRIETKYREFTLYSGIKETLKRMVIPIFAAFLFVLTAVNKNGLVTVMSFIVLSVVINMVIILLMSVYYYRFFEAGIVDDIVSRWKEFRPVPLLVTVGAKDPATNLGNLPGTPVRDLADYGTMEFPDD